MGSYVCFLSPLIAIMMWVSFTSSFYPSLTNFSVDYFLIQKGNVHIASPYKGNASSPYWYHGGFNIRAFLAWAIGVAIVINGLAGSFQQDYNIGSKHLYSLGMLLSFATAGTLYYIFNLIWPVEIYPAEHFDAPKSIEYMKATDVYFEDDDVIVGTDLSN
jgi:NCS1 family nucleobase:cation symporter-1